ncbi:hypothetical protein GN958_ATG16093 [Phytophthora infestans]|uniref:Uncharacterized protein n=1 Tax=Phytophthora infestans TaxID=4787 RepID=A0A8S9U5Y5_PHYIN|nr:hypothetical protein GN958_ATG16093 [Phytophthora infestans]
MVSTTLPLRNSTSPTEPQSESPIRKTKRARNATSSSTIIQRRKKAEIETLRKESARLQACITHLSTSGGQKKPLAITKRDEIQSESHRHAFYQYRQRHQSEQMNRKLKEKLKREESTASKFVFFLTEMC